MADTTYVIASERGHLPFCVLILSSYRALISTRKSFVSFGRPFLLIST